MGCFSANNYFPNVQYLVEWLVWVNLNITPFFNSLVFPQTCPLRQTRFPVVSSEAEEGAWLNFHSLILSEDSEKRNSNYYRFNYALLVKQLSEIGTFFSVLLISTKLPFESWCVLNEKMFAIWTLAFASVFKGRKTICGLKPVSPLILQVTNRI